MHSWVSKEESFQFDIVGEVWIGAMLLLVRNGHTIKYAHDSIRY